MEEKYNPETDPFYDAKVAASNLITSILNVPTRLLDKGTSSRVLLTLASAAGGYVTATQMGLTGWEAALSAFAVSIPGSTYTIMKSVQHIKETGQQGKILQETTQNAADAATEPQAGSVEVADKVVYPFPVDPNQMYPITDKPYQDFEWAENMLTEVNISVYDPAVQDDYAAQITSTVKARLDRAWIYEFKDAGAIGEVRLPTPDDFDILPQSGELTREMKESVKAEFNALLPASCGYLSTKIKNIVLLMSAYSRIFDIMNYLDQLGSKVNWDKIKTLEELGRRGLGAV